MSTKHVNQIFVSLKTARLKSRKAKLTTKTEILTYVLGEIDRQKVKDESDEACIKVVKKVRDNLKEALAVKHTDKLQAEILILGEFLPVTMSKEYMQDTIKSIIAGGANNIGQVFGMLNAHAKKQNVLVDGNAARLVITEALK